MKNIDIIILHYGDITITKECVQSIEKHAKEYRRIILINNDTNIHLEQSISTTNKRKIINAQKNLGFAAGVNVGIKLALKEHAEYVCLINNDVTLKKDFVKPLINFFEKQKDAGIAGSIIEFSLHQQIMFDHGATLNRLNGVGKHRNELTIKIDHPLMVDYVSGCCMMIKKEVFDKIGYFDEQFFMYYEDVDFCLRAKKAGYMTYIVPDAVIQHALSKTIGRSSENLTYQLVKSNLRFLRKHKEFPLSFLALVSQIGKFSVKMPGHLPLIHKALMDA